MTKNFTIWTAHVTTGSNSGNGRTTNEEIRQTAKYTDGDITIISEIEDDM